MNILLVEDEANVSAFIKKGLEEYGYHVTQAFDGELGLKLALQNPYDLIILDVILPGLNGLQVCERIREKGVYDIPILMLTALGSTEDVVTGLESGADDYLKKPFKFQELLARVRVLLRRGKLGALSQVLRLEDLELDINKKTVQRKGEAIQLTAKEFNLLAYLMRNQAKVVSRAEILENVWQMSFDPGTNVIDVYVNYLRKKVDRDYDPKLIHTVVGMGYILKAK
ncbi:MAG: response regulator transcription factor [Bacteroidota bacterium]